MDRPEHIPDDELEALQYEKLRNQYNRYMRLYRSKHKEKIKEINERYYRRHKKENEREQ